MAATQTANLTRTEIVNEAKWLVFTSGPENALTTLDENDPGWSPVDRAAIEAEIARQVERVRRFLFGA